MLHKNIAYLLTLLLLSLSAFTQAQTPLPDRDIQFQANSAPVGTWSDGITLWVADTGADRIFAYTLSTGMRDTTKEFDLATINSFPQGIWSNGTTMWVANAFENRIFAYDISDITNVSRDSDKDIPLAPATPADPTDPSSVQIPANIGTQGIWSDGDTMWVADIGADRIFVYDISNITDTDPMTVGVSRDITKEFNLAPTNRDPRGIWSDRNPASPSATDTLWVVNSGADRIFAYNLSTGVRDADSIAKDIVLDTRNEETEGIWSNDSTTLWVVDSSTANRIFAYDISNITDMDDTTNGVTLVTDSGFDLHREPNQPSGIWSDGETLWVKGNFNFGLNTSLFAYTLAGGARDTGSEFILDTPVVLSGNIWSDGETLWMVENPGTGGIFAYHFSGVMRGMPDPSQDITTMAPANNNPQGIWSNANINPPGDDDTLWVADIFENRIFAYHLSGSMRGMPDPDKDIVLDTANGSPTGIWSNGHTMWVADRSADRVFAYDLSTHMPDGTLTRANTQEIDLSIGDNDDPESIWSDGTTLWVADVSDDRIYVYTLPAADPILTEITAVPTLTNTNTPQYTFHSTEAGDITYAGACGNGDINEARTGVNTTITFTGLLDGTTYTDCTITVTDATGDTSDALEVSDFTVDTTEPTVRLIADMQTVSVGSQVTLTATISDRTGAILNYAWNQTMGTDVALTTATGTDTVALTTGTGTGTVELTTDTGTLTTTFIAPATAGDLAFTLTVTDDAGNPPASDSVTISVITPSVNASADQILVVGSATVTLIATLMPVGLTGTIYAWSQVVAPGSPTVTLLNPTGSMTTFTAPNSDDILTFEVNATNGAERFSDTVSVTVDATRPTVDRIVAPATASGDFPITIEFSEPVTGFDETNIGVGSGTASNFAGSGSSYTATITPSAGLLVTGGTITIGIAANVAMDLAGNQNEAATEVQVRFVTDTTPPRLVRIIRMTPSTPVTNSGTLTWAVVFNEPVSNIDATDFGLTALATSGTAIDVSTVTLAVVGNDGDSSYQVTASGGNLADLNGTVRLNIFPAGDGITDIAGNRLIDFTTTIDPNTGILGVVESYTLENTAPMLMEVRAVTPTTTDDTTPEYIFRSSEAGTASYPRDCTSGTTTPPTTLVISGTNTITFNDLAEGEYGAGREFECTITVTDAVGNTSAPLAVSDFTVDTIPTVSAITTTTAAGSYGIGQVIGIQVILTEDVVVTGSPVLSLNNGGQAVYTGISGSSTLTFNYKVSAGQGTASLDVLNDDALSLAGASINDLSGNPATRSLAGVATDALNNIRISTPSVIRVSGGSGNYRAGDAVTIRVQFSEEIMVSPDAGLAPDEAPLQLALETGDVDRMATFSALATTAISNDTLEFIYRVEQGDRSQDLAYTSPNALVAVGDTLVTGAAPGLSDAELRAANLGALLSLPTLDAASSLAGSSDIVIGVLLEEQNARLNEILLPKIAQAMSAATVDAITRRIESGGGDSQASLSSGLSSALSSGISDILPFGLSSLKDLDLSWLKSFAYDFLMDKAEQSARSGSIGLDALGSGFDIKGMLRGFDIKRVLGNSEFVMPLNASGDGTGSGATSSMVLWGSGNYSNLSDNDDGLDYDGDIYSINLGIDSQISQETLLGVSVNWSNSDFDYRDATTVQTGDYGYRLYGINPYISWSPQGLGGSNLWATVGYGIGEIENQIEGIEKVETDTRQYQFSGGGRYILTSSADQLSQLSIKGDLTLLRVDIDQSAGFLGNDIDSQSFRLLLQGSSVFNYAGYSFTPSLEGGLRYDLGDGDTGGGIELSPAFTYKSLDEHILIEGRGRYLIAGQHDQWGLSVLARIDQARHGRGLSFSMHPTWGQSQGQAEQLTAHNGSRFNDYRAAKAEAQMKTELSYGMHMSHILGQTMLLTPYAEFTLGENARYYQFGQRLSIGELLSLSFKLSHHQRRGYADDNHLGLESAINF